MADKNNEELRELFASIKKNSANDEDVRKWSNDELDRLLKQTRRTDGENENDETEEDVIPTVYEQPDAYPVGEISDGRPFSSPDATVSTTGLIDSERIRAIMEDKSTEKKSNKDFKRMFSGGKSKISDFLNNVKTKAQSIAELTKTEKSDEFEEQYRLDDDFESEDEEPQENTAEEAVPEEKVETKTKVVPIVEGKDGKEKAVPANEVQKSENGQEKDDSETESEAETETESESESENDSDVKVYIAPEKEEPKKTADNDMRAKMREAMEAGQIVFSGFEDITDEPEKISEEDAEQELFEKRREKIRKFTLFGEEENNDPYADESSREKLDSLFDAPEEKPQKKETEEFVGVEYTQIKDARRIRRYLTSQKKKSLHRVISQAALLVAAVILSIVASSATTVAGDKILTIFFNLIIITASVVVSNQTLVSSFESIKKKKMNVNTAISAAAIVCFIQNLLMLALYFADKNTVSVFSAAGVTMLLAAEINGYVTCFRTKDAMELCTGERQDRLHSIEGIADDKDAAELGKSVQAKSPRIRYSCKTRFPAHLIELCTGETSADKRIKLFLPIILLLSVINCAAAWVSNGHFAVGFAAFTATFCLCVPFASPLLIQLPLRWINKRLNRTGSMISSQSSVDELCRTNAIIIDSKDLFDQKGCAMLNCCDFKNVRVDDAMLYAAAMVIRSGSPLTNVFYQAISNRRDLLPTVKSFSYEEKLGVSGWIYGQKVILGNRALMENHNIELPEGINEEKYLMNGHEVLYLAIAHTAAMMIVVDYAPNKRLAPYLKKLKNSGVSILVRNCDPNVTEHMISACYDMKLDNIKIINSNAGRVFKKYKTRPKLTTKAACVHDGSTYSFAKILCISAMLRHVFKTANTLTLIGMLAGFAIVLILSILNVIADLPAIFIIMTQMIISLAFVGAVRVGMSQSR